MANLYLLIEDDELPSSTHVKLHHVVFPVAASSCLNAMWFFRPEELEPVSILSDCRATDSRCFIIAAIERS